MPNPKTIPLEIGAAKHRFWKQVRITNATNCWEWKGYRSTPTGIHKGGYGRFSYKHRKYYAHRLAVYFGHVAADTLPRSLNGDVVMHLCDNPACCNPSHLVDASASENTADMHAKGRHTQAAEEVPF